MEQWWEGRGDASKQVRVCLETLPHCPLHGTVRADSAAAFFRAFRFWEQLFWGARSPVVVVHSAENDAVLLCLELPAVGPCRRTLRYDIGTHVHVTVLMFLWCVLPTEKREPDRDVFEKNVPLILPEDFQEQGLPWAHV